MKSKPWFFVLLSLALALSACQGQSAGIKDSCLVGRWMVTSDDAFGRAMLPAGAFTPDQLKFNNVMSAAAYDIRADGTIRLLALRWTALFDVYVDRTVLPLELTLDGAVDAELQVKGDTLTVGKVIRQGAVFAAYFDDNEMMTSKDVQEFAPLFTPGAQTAQYTCSGDDLTLVMQTPAGGQQTFTLLRVVMQTPQP